MKRPASARTSSALSARISSTSRGSLPCSAASCARPRAGLDVGERDDAPFGLGHRLVRDDEHVAGAQPGLRQPRGRAASSAARSSPAPISGRPGSASARDAHAAARRELRQQRAGARRGGRQPASASRRAARSPGVSTSSSSERSAATRTSAPAAAPRPAWRASEPGPKEGAHHVRRGEQQRVRARAVPVGDDHHAPARRSRARRAPAARRPRPGRAPGSRRARAGPARRPRCTASATPSSAASECPASAGSGTTSRAGLAPPRPPRAARR